MFPTYSLLKLAVSSIIGAYKSMAIMCSRKENEIFHHQVTSVGPLLHP